MTGATIPDQVNPPKLLKRSQQLGQGPTQIPNPELRHPDLFAEVCDERLGILHGQQHPTPSDHPLLRATIAKQAFDFTAI